MITQEEVKKIAHLARLQLEDYEVSRLSADLSAVLDNFETIRSLDTGGSAMQNTESGVKNVTREDIVRENILGNPEELLKKAKTVDGYVVVPAVFSNSEAV